MNIVYFCSGQEDTSMTDESKYKDENDLWQKSFKEKYKGVGERGIIC